MIEVKFKNNKGIFQNNSIINHGVCLKLLIIEKMEINYSEFIENEALNSNNQGSPSILFISNKIIYGLIQIKHCNFIKNSAYHFQNLGFFLWTFY